MNLPTPLSNAQEAAQNARGMARTVARYATNSDSRVMDCGLNKARACNNIFRYPSPYGWSDGVPFGSPVFSFISDGWPDFRQNAAQNPSPFKKHFPLSANAAMCPPEADSFRKGRKTWKDIRKNVRPNIQPNSQQPFFARALLWRLSLAARPQANRPLLVRALGSQQPPFLVAALPLVRLSAVPATSSTAKKTRTSVTNQNSPTAPWRPISQTKAVRAPVGTGGFFRVHCLRFARGPRT